MIHEKHVNRLNSQKRKFFLMINLTVRLLSAEVLMVNSVNVSLPHFEPCFKTVIYTRVGLYFETVNYE